MATAREFPGVVPLKPQTRCECDEREECGHGQNCGRDAVRLVTVQFHPTAEQEAEVMRAGGEVSYFEHVPMCAACAEYAERGK
jgi:hypothetical protein